MENKGCEIMIYELESPNGKVYEIEAPEGATQEELINFVLSQQSPNEIAQEEVPKDTGNWADDVVDSVTNFTKQNASDIYNIGKAVLIPSERNKMIKDYIKSDTFADTLHPALQGITFAESDEIYGAGKAAFDKAVGSDESYNELYKKYRNEERDRINRSYDRSPVLAPLSEIGGAILSGVGTAGAGSALNISSKVPKLTNAIGKISLPVKSSMGGAVYGVGEANEVKDIPARSLEYGVYGLGGGLGSKFIKYRYNNIQPAVKNLNEVLKEKNILKVPGASARVATSAVGVPDKWGKKLSDYTSKGLQKVDQRFSNGKTINSLDDVVDDVKSNLSDISEGHFWQAVPTKFGDLPGKLQTAKGKQGLIKTGYNIGKYLLNKNKNNPQVTDKEVTNLYQYMIQNNVPKVNTGNVSKVVNKTNKVTPIIKPKVETDLLTDTINQDKVRLYNLQNNLQKYNAGSFDDAYQPYKKQHLLNQIRNRDVPKKKVESVVNDTINNTIKDPGKVIQAQMMVLTKKLQKGEISPSLYKEAEVAASKMDSEGLDAIVRAANKRAPTAKELKELDMYNKNIQSNIEMDNLNSEMNKLKSLTKNAPRK